MRMRWQEGTELPNVKRYLKYDKELSTILWTIILLLLSYVAVAVSVSIVMAVKKNSFLHPPLA
jgi:hypothetical protein